jgi:hypothetical protein
MGATEIAKAVGCKRGNVYKALKAAGLNYAGRSLHLMLGTPWHGTRGVRTSPRKVPDLSV